MLFNVKAIQKPPPVSKTWNDAVFDIIDALTAPVLTFSQSWADTIPKRLLDLVPLERMAGNMKKEDHATDIECVIYIYTRTLEAPMPSEWVNIYTHLSCKVCQKWFKENHWEEVNAPRELNAWLTSKLNDLRRFIYERRRKIVRQRIRQEETVNKDSNKKTDSSKEPSTSVQSSQISFKF